MRKTKWFMLLAVAAIAAAWVNGRPGASAPQDELAAHRDNGCVTCHSALVRPLKVSSRYFEWHQSKHRARGVGCEKCHGGDPAAKEMKAAHVGVQKPADAASRLHYQNLPETCGSCHKEVVRAFTGSRHFQQLKNSNLGPSCTTCHEHMATKVIYSPLETKNLCASCHDTVGGPQRPRPEITAAAHDVMLAFSRAKAALEWADIVTTQGEQRGLSLKAEREELRATSARLKDARLSWHEFRLDATRRRADDVFERATKVKDKAWQRLMGR
jgi:hypothetical protein